MHRGDLVAALARAFPAGRLHTGHRLLSLVDDGDTVEARFKNGETTRANVVVGADGIHSAVRAAQFGPETPHFTGCVAYRGVIPAARLPHLDMEPALQVWMGPHSHILHHYVSGLRLVNVVAVMEQDTWTKESWTEPGDVADLLAAYKDWHPQVRAILQAFDRRSVGQSLSGCPCRGGPEAALPSSVMPVTRCCRSWRKEPRRRWRTA
jgi:salicylate hydroxylase